MRRQRPTASARCLSSVARRSPPLPEVRMVSALYSEGSRVPARCFSASKPLTTAASRGHSGRLRADHHRWRDSSQSRRVTRDRAGGGRGRYQPPDALWLASLGRAGRAGFAQSPEDRAGMVMRLAGTRRSEVSPVSLFAGPERKRLSKPVRDR